MIASEGGFTALLLWRAQGRCQMDASEHDAAQDVLLKFPFLWTGLWGPVGLWKGPVVAKDQVEGRTDQRRELEPPAKCAPDFLPGLTFW